MRLRIVQALAGRNLTPLELVEELGDVPQATLYRHVNRLEDGGLLQIVEERQVRGGVERTYGLVEGATTLAGDDLADADTATHLAYFATFTGSLLASWARYLGDGEPPDLEADGAGYRQVPLWLSDDEYAAFLADLGAVVARAYAHEPTPERRRRLLTTIVHPDG